jgi:hypothetical protein
MLKRFGTKAVAVDPRIYEGLWVLLAAAAINILTGTVDASSNLLPRLSTGILLLLLGIFLFLISQCAREVREYALQLQVEARRGRLREHILAAIDAPGYSSLPIATGRWLALAILDCVALLTVWLIIVL